MLMDTDVVKNNRKNLIVWKVAQLIIASVYQYKIIRVCEIT